MQANTYANRVKELRTLIEERDLSRLSRRLLDLFSDIDFSNDLKRKAIALRANYNAFAQLEQAETTHEDWGKMCKEAAELLSEIILHLSNIPTEEQTIGKAASLGKEVVFEAKAITKIFRSPKFTFQLPPIDLDLRMGEITGIVGENGNGKTTLLRIVAGDLQISGGNIRYPYFDVERDDWYGIKQNIAFIPQHLPVWNGFLKENLHFTAAIHGIKGRENEERVDLVIHRLGLTKYEDALWNEISSGYKLRFELARALVWYPSLLIIDEPLANLDINTQQVFLQDLQYLAKSTQNPMSILLSSQHLHELESIADNIIFIKNGEALYNGSMKDFGKDRIKNQFEINTSSTKAELEEILADVSNVHIEDHGSTKTIHTPIHIDANSLLRKLIAAEVQLTYFRDISTSTLKLFRENVTKN